MVSVMKIFISFIIKASSLLEVQVFYYLPAGIDIISLRYVLSGVKIIYFVYIDPLAFLILRGGGGGGGGVGLL